MKLPSLKLKDKFAKEKFSFGLDIGTALIKLVKLKFFKDTVELCGGEPTQTPVPMMKSSDKGFTLIEVMFAVAILAFALCGILLTYINMFILSDLSRDFTLATNGVQAEMEKIKSTDFTGLLALNNTKFDIAGFPTNNAKGVVFVTDHPGDYNYLRQVRIIACFKSRNRVLGEDTNLNGILDSGEDINPNNNRLDSPIEMVTLIAKPLP